MKKPITGTTRKDSFHSDKPIVSIIHYVFVRYVKLYQRDSGVIIKYLYDTILYYFFRGHITTLFWKVILTMLWNLTLIPVFFFVVKSFIYLVLCFHNYILVCFNAVLLDYLSQKYKESVWVIFIVSVLTKLEYFLDNLWGLRLLYYKLYGILSYYRITLLNILEKYKDKVLIRLNISFDRFLHRTTQRIRKMKKISEIENQDIYIWYRGKRLWIYFHYILPIKKFFFRIKFLIRNFLKLTLIIHLFYNLFKYFKIRLHLLSRCIDHISYKIHVFFIKSTIGFFYKIECKVYISFYILQLYIYNILVVLLDLCAIFMPNKLVLYFANTHAKVIFNLFFFITVLYVVVFVSFLQNYSNLYEICLYAYFFQSAYIYIIFLIYSSKEELIWINNFLLYILICLYIGLFINNMYSMPNLQFTLSIFLLFVIIVICYWNDQLSLACDTSLIKSNNRDSFSLTFYECYVDRQSKIYIYFFIMVYSFMQQKVAFDWFWIIANTNYKEGFIITNLTKGTKLSFTYDINNKVFMYKHIKQYNCSENEVLYYMYNYVVGERLCIKTRYILVRGSNLYFVTIINNRIKYLKITNEIVNKVIKNVFYYKYKIKFFRNRYV